MKPIYLLCSALCCTLITLPTLALAQDEEIPPLPTSEEEIPALPTKEEDEAQKKAEQEKARKERATQQANTPAPKPQTYSLGTRLVGRFKHSLRAATALQTTGYTVGTTTSRGPGQFSSRDNAGIGGPVAMGYTLQERNGVISGLVLAALAQGGLVLGAGFIGMSAYQYVGSTTTREYHADGSVWERRTNYYELTADSDEKFASAQGLLDAANSGETMGSLAGYQGGQNFEFTYYTDDWLGRGTGQTQGIRANFLLGMPVSERMLFELGYGWGRATSAYEGRLVESRFNGMPVRLLAPLGPFMAQAGLDMNAAKLLTLLGDEPNDREVVATWPITLALHAYIWRLHASAGVEVSRLLKLDVGYNLNLGMRF